MATGTAPKLGRAAERAERLKASPRMFDSPLLDRFSRVHPVVPLLVFVPVIALLLVLAADRASAGTVVLLTGLGLVFWSFSEYWLHRVVFHFEPDEGIGRRLHWIIHGVHHDHPNDPLRLVMPPSASIPLAALFLLLFRVVLGTPYWLPFAAGFLLGYLVYDMTHYHVHHHRPKTRLGRKLREQHMRHHFQDHTTAFGVSSPVWDHVFRTVPRRRRRRTGAPPG
jgi:sterol desaturase/sphingolipid hydroxylase (fatty acid hydroxylase superfamily)